MGETTANRNVLNIITTYSYISRVSSAVNFTMQITFIYVLQSYATTTSPHFKGLFRSDKPKSPLVLHSSTPFSQRPPEDMILGQLCPFFTTYCLHLPGFPSCGIARKFPTKILKACVSNFRITYLDHYKYLYEQLYYSSAFMT